ncbi:GntR family transcriptional regulator [Limosilactobacillus viscerum]|uniref:GntR family transcriptional regulator n=1 Tax=Limosilactobacillus viscerum TaxID=2993450 RepID=UPI0024BA2A5F|nr:GntR family transcriptional regulator [Limosilactobacillus viscerum]
MATKYETVKEKIRKVISSGKYKPGDQLPTESALMNEYHVSRYTIRRAMGELENEHYIYRIQGGGMFVEDWQANHEQPVTQKVVGVITTHLADYIFPSIISGIDRTLSSHGYSILLGNTHNDHEQERLSLQRMLDSNVDGLILEPTQSARPNPNEDLYRQIEQSHIPAMFIDAHYDTSSLPYIDIADRETEWKLVNCLFKKGHQRILGVFKIDDLQGVGRLQGYMDAYTERPDLTLASDVIMYQSSDDIARIFDKIAQHLQGPDRPTAIACYNDELAIQVMDVVRSLGMKIPDDVSIVGFDDYLLSAYVLPGLTTAVHPKNKMGMDAGNMILKLIKGEKVEPIVYHPEIVERKSVRKVTNS